MVISSGRRGDQVSLTSVLYEFPQQVYLNFDFLLEEEKPGTSSALSVYLLSKQRAPTKMDYLKYSIHGEHWKKGSIDIPRGIFQVMFLVTLGQSFLSDVYLDNIAFFHRSDSRPTIIKPTGMSNIYL